MSEQVEETTENSQTDDFDIEALQSSLEDVLSEDLSQEEEIADEVVEETKEEVEEIVEDEPFDIDAAINSGEPVSLSDKITQEQADEAAKSRGWNEEGKDKYGHSISSYEFLERASFFKKNDLLKGDIDDINKKLSKVLEQNQQIAQKSIEKQERMRKEFEEEKAKLLSEDFLDSDGIARLKEVDAGIADNAVTDKPISQDEAVEIYEKASVSFKEENDWYGTNRAMTALADKVGTEYATNYYEENGVLPEPEKTFGYVLEEIKKDFPDKPEESPKKATKVASGSRVVTQTNKPKKKTLADLPEDQRAIAAEVIEATGQSEESYLSTYNF